VDPRPRLRLERRQRRRRLRRLALLLLDLEGRDQAVAGAAVEQGADLALAAKRRAGDRRPPLQQPQVEIVARDLRGERDAEVAAVP
jgi:hypothetical protein